MTSKKVFFSEGGARLVSTSTWGAYNTWTCQVSTHQIEHKIQYSTRGKSEQSHSGKLHCSNFNLNIAAYTRVHSSEMFTILDLKVKKYIDTHARFTLIFMYDISKIDYKNSHGFSVPISWVLCIEKSRIYSESLRTSIY